MTPIKPAGNEGWYGGAGVNGAGTGTSAVSQPESRSLSPLPTLPPLQNRSTQQVVLPSLARFSVDGTPEGEVDMRVGFVHYRCVLLFRLGKRWEKKCVYLSCNCLSFSTAGRTQGAKVCVGRGGRIDKSIPEIIVYVKGGLREKHAGVSEINRIKCDAHGQGGRDR
ncbi:hypothetical protein AG1IA_02017 [Rhizoctonia solani AG-1 IA]|uniref:Uncharacterized protein n=1 Tax=Thanatephorus cucumeris (strain AG1-IA) TaxID=983506 RepID=L8X4B6_THACA|nr:hypothetical protein AG1IA_02017 [Rhizoctonia solani AG-1 IA]